jgi:uncharacterized protein (TIGR00297 family)
MTRVSRQIPAPVFSETRRQIVHITMGAWALLLRWIAWPHAAALAVAALLFNVFLLPRVGGRGLYRDAEVGRGLPIGILLYPLSVLLLVLTFRDRLDIVAAAWGIMAAGDGFATIAGRAWGRRRLPWNPEKTVEGTLAFIIAGSVAGVFLAMWVSPTPRLYLWIAPVAAAVVAALVESIPVRLDDNLSVPFSAAAVLWLGSLVSVNEGQLAGLEPRLAAGLALNVAVGAAGFFARTVSASGAVAGVAIGIIIFAGAGWQGWALLLAAFIAASAVSRIGLRRKIALGIAEERGGRRGAGNAIANTGVAACAAAIALVGQHAHQEASFIALTASLVAGASDTVASEIGKAWGRRTFLVTSLRPVPPGTPGAFSLEGTAALILSAVALAGLGWRLGLIGFEAISIVAVAAVVASFAESVLGATLEPRRILNNDLLNFVTTAGAAGLALILAGSAG